MKNKLAFVDNPAAPEVFVSYLKGFAVDGQNVHLTFVSVRTNHETSPGPQSETVCLRLVMAAAAVQNMVEFLAAAAAQPPAGQAVQ